MDELKLKELNKWWTECLAKLGRDPERSEQLLAQVPDRLTYARAERLKRLYSKLCDFLSADLNNCPGEAWPTQVRLAKALAWSERDVRVYLRMLEVLGLVYTNRTRHRPRQCATRNHYRLMPPLTDQPARRVPVATGT